MKRYFFIPVFFCLLAVSCNRDTGRSQSPIPFVRETVGDTSNVYHKLVSSYDCPDSGSIAVIGPVGNVAVFSEFLMQADMFDNVTGKPHPDGLPDFAGETISPLIDFANAPYENYIGENNEDFLRELVVKDALMSIMDRCNANPYDHNLTVSKAPAKLIVLASSYMSGFGYYEIRDMFAGIGRQVSLIAPVQALVHYVLERFPEPEAIGIWADNSVLGAGVYTYVFQQETKARDLRRLETFGFTPEVTDDPYANLIAYLDRYKDYGGKKPLSFVLVDDFSLSDMADSMNVAINVLRQSEDDSMTGYRELISDSFRFVTAKKALAEACYDCLRSSNSFTHKIAYPALKGYMTVPAADISISSKIEGTAFIDEFKYSRAPGSDMDTFKLIQLSHRYLQPEDMDLIRKESPEIFKSLSYVR